YKNHSRAGLSQLEYFLAAVRVLAHTAFGLYNMRHGPPFARPAVCPARSRIRVRPHPRPECADAGGAVVTPCKPALPAARARRTRAAARAVDRARARAGARAGARLRRERDARPWPGPGHRHLVRGQSGPHPDLA